MAPVFLYDGDCAFCSTCARFLERRIPNPASVQAWQFSDLDDLGVSQDECETAVQWIEGGKVTAGPRAIADLLQSSTGVWKAAGHVAALPPVQWAARPVYRWVANNRDKMPGGTATCALPQSERPARLESTD
jgi:predicted DCC family thiol-disulfide oxidoreductase YuxK